LTSGALLGAGVAGFVALPLLGQPVTLAGAAAVNLAMGLGAVALGVRMPVLAEDAPALGPAPTGGAAVLFAFALSGSASMIDQIAWNRSFGLFTGSTTYAFSLIVCAFLGGLAAGGHLFARFVDRARDREGLLALVNVGIAVTTAVLIPIIGLLPWLLVEPLAARADSRRRCWGLRRRGRARGVGRVGCRWWERGSGSFRRGVRRTGGTTCMRERGAFEAERQLAEGGEPALHPRGERLHRHVPQPHAPRRPVHLPLRARRPLPWAPGPHRRGPSGAHQQIQPDTHRAERQDGDQQPVPRQAEGRPARRLQERRERERHLPDGEQRDRAPPEADAGPVQQHEQPSAPRQVHQPRGEGQQLGGSVRGGGAGQLRRGEVPPAR